MTYARMTAALLLALCLATAALGITKTELPKKTARKAAASARKRPAAKPSHTKKAGAGAKKPAPKPAPKGDNGGRPLDRKYASSVSAAKVGEVIRFGNYEQDGDPDNGREPIEWIVLSIDGDGDLLVVSRCGLDAVPYSYDRVSAGWEDCSLRDWLNEDFCYYAFDNDELSHIYNVNISEDSEEEDSVFILDPYMAETLFSSDASRCAYATAYAKEQGAQVNGIGCCRSWLMAEDSVIAAPYLDYGGSIAEAGNSVDSGVIAVRPAMFIDRTAKMKTANSYEEKIPSEFLTEGAIDSSGYDRLTRKMSASAGSGSGDKETVTFGRYGGQAIDWLVLDKTDTDMLLISAEALDCRKYNDTNETVTWENCSLRKWLNSSFYTAAFSAAERDRIILSTVANPDTETCRTEGGNDTEDKVFLLSLDEARELFDSDSGRLCRPSAYAREHGIYVFHKNGCSWWWLRSPGKPGCAANVNYFGGRAINGTPVNEADTLCRGGGVRPVIRIRL